MDERGRERARRPPRRRPPRHPDLLVPWNPRGADAGRHRWGAHERALAHPDGTRVWVTVTSRQLTDADGRLTGTLYTLFDTGERRRREVELRLRLQRQEALLEFAERAAGRSSFEELVDAAMATVQEQLDVEFVAMGGIDTDRAEGWALAVRGWDPEALGVQNGAPPRRNALAPGSATLSPRGPGSRSGQRLHDPDRRRRRSAARRRRGPLRRDRALRRRPRGDRRALAAARGDRRRGDRGDGVGCPPAHPALGLRGLGAAPRRGTAPLAAQR